MEENWVKVHATANLQDAEILKAMLEANDIYAVNINKKDQSYTVFGEIEIYVNKENEESAKSLIKEFYKTEDE